MMHAEKLNEIVLDKNDAVLTQLNIAFNTFRQFAEEAQDALNAIHLFELQDMLAEKMGSHDKSDVIFSYIFNNDDYTTLNDAVLAAYKAQWMRIISFKQC